MTSFAIKIIAIATMVIDHLGVFFFPNILLLRIIGRLSFPLFAWSIANGARYTKNIYKYGQRLLIFAFISQIPYALNFVNPGDNPLSDLNILFTLFLGLLSIGIHIKLPENKKYLAFIICTLIAIAGEILNVDYGGLGIISIFLFYFFFDDKLKMFLFQLNVYALKSVLLQKEWASGYIQILAVLSLLVIFSYNGKRGKPFKWFFYIFYPLHFLVIYALRLALR